MEIRLARPEDAEAIRAIYNAEVLGSTVTFDLEPRTAEEQRAWMARHQGAHPAVVAVRRGRPWPGSGPCRRFVTAPPTPPRSRTPSTSTAPGGARGSGRLLLDELVALAVARGFHTVIARISGDNEPSIALHRACGFELVGVEREVGRKFGRWIDVAVLQRML